MPHVYKHSIICPVHKKGNVVMCDNYRAVTLLYTTYIILEYVVYAKLC
jgi:hypothetical protein